MRSMTLKTVEVVHCLIAERIPLGYTTRSAMAESRRVAGLYVAERRLPQVCDLEDIDEVDIVAWLRSQGYETLEEPLPPYIENHKRVVSGEWRPR